MGHGISQWWSWGFAAVGLTAMFLAGRKKAVGWLIGALVQIVWLFYAVYTRQWGFIVTAVGYGTMQTLIWLQWRAADRAAAATAEAGPT
jgi:hypothetical protein